MSLVVVIKTALGLIGFLLSARPPVVDKEMSVTADSKRIIVRIFLYLQTELGLPIISTYGATGWYRKSQRRGRSTTLCWVRRTADCEDNSFHLLLFTNIWIHSRHVSLVMQWSRLHTLSERARNAENIASSFIWGPMKTVVSCYKPKRRRYIQGAPIATGHTESVYNYRLEFPPSIYPGQNELMIESGRTPS